MIVTSSLARLPAAAKCHCEEHFAYAQHKLRDEAFSWPAERLLRCPFAALRTGPAATHEIAVAIVSKSKCSESWAPTFRTVTNPVHGEGYADESEIVRGEAKSGITHLHGHATVSIVHDNRHYVLTLRLVEKGESMATIVTWLLNRLKFI